jgi:hypothetical protein
MRLQRMIQRLRRAVAIVQQHVDRRRLLTGPIQANGLVANGPILRHGGSVGIQRLSITVVGNEFLVLSQRLIIGMVGVLHGRERSAVRGSAIQQQRFQCRHPHLGRRVLRILQDGNAGE